MIAAHDLHHEVSQWSSKDNDIISAAKKVALYMAKLSKLVRQDSQRTKKELIACAKAIADAAEHVARIARELANECTDKRIRLVRKRLLSNCNKILHIHFVSEFIAHI